MRVANAPVSWGVIEFESAGERGGFRRVLDEMQQTGYQGTELGDWGFLPTEPEVLRGELENRELALLGAFVPVDLRDREAHEAGAQQALRVARLMANTTGDDGPFVVLSDDNGSDPVRTKHAGRIRPDQSMTDREWSEFARGAEQVANRVAQETDLRTVFHHHCAGFIETPGEVEELLERTDPQLLGLCLDTGHYRYGGGDPVRAVQRFGDRIWHVHFKDCDPTVAERARTEDWDYFEAVRQGVFCELGQGEVDFEAVRDALQSSGYDGWIVVEQDVFPGLGTPVESAQRNREFLRGLGL